MDPSWGVSFPLIQKLLPSSARFAAAFLLALAPALLRAQEGFPPESPEHQALTLASPFLGDEAFSLRQDYWRGKISPTTGRAVKLQFFKRNVYQLFFGATPADLPPKSKLFLHIYDGENQEVAKAEGEPGDTAVALEFNNTLATGVYLVLMRIEAPPGPFAAAEVPSVMFYGWK